MQLEKQPPFELILIKNYRSLKEIKFNVAKMNFFVGENNTGKTSLMKLLENIFELRYINFKDNYLEKFTMDQLQFDKNEPLVIFRHKFHKSNDETEFMFELLTIDTISKYEFPLIKEIYTLDPQKNIINIKLNYKIISKKYATKVDKIVEIEKIAVKLYDSKILKKYEIAMIEDNDCEEQATKIFKEISELEKSNNTPIKELNRIFSKDYRKANELEIKRIIENKENIDSESTLKSQDSKFILEDILFDEMPSIDINTIYLLSLFYLSEEGNETEDNKKNIDLQYLDLTHFGMRVKNIRYFDMKFYKSYYLRPLREEFRKFYSFDEVLSSKTTDVSFLNEIRKNKPLLKDVEEYGIKTNMFSKINLSETYISQFKFIIPEYQRQNIKSNLSISGTGISQSLPILQTFHLSLRFKYIYVEQPEVHLHPKAQAELGSLFFKYLNFEETMEERQKIFFVETHSQFLINRFRYEIFLKNKESKNKNAGSFNDVNIIFIYSETREKTSYFIIKIDNTGKFINLPKEYKDFFIDESIKILSINSPKVQN